MSSEVLAVSGVLFIQETLMSTWFFWSMLFLAQTSQFVPVANNSEIMKVFIEPASNEVFNVGLGIPDTDEGWKAVEDNAIILGESANLLLLPERAEGREGWIESAQDLAEASRRSLELARSHSDDVDAWFDLADELLLTCSGCHDAYWLVD